MGSEHLLDWMPTCRTAKAKDRQKSGSAHLQHEPLAEECGVGCAGTP